MSFSHKAKSPKLELHSEFSIYLYLKLSKIFKKEKIFRKMAVIKKKQQKNCGFLYVFSWLSHKFLFSPCTCIGVSFTKTKPF
jgi:hypothetical protein